MNATYEKIAKWAVLGITNDSFSISMIVDVLRECDDLNFISKCTAVAHRHGNHHVVGIYLAHLWDKHFDKFKSAFLTAAVESSSVKAFVYYVRASGPFTRRSFGTTGKKLLGQWLDRQPLQKLLDDPAWLVSMRDIIRLSHPKPSSEHRMLLYKHLCEHHLSLNEAVKLAAVVVVQTKRLPGAVVSIPSSTNRALLELLHPEPPSWVEFVNREIDEQVISL